MTSITINIAKDFSPDPYGRYPDHDPTSNGERFRESWLVPALSFDSVIIEMNGAASYGPSFLEESFGGLVRLRYATAKDVLDKFEFRHKSKAIIEEVRRYIEDGTKIRSDPRAGMPKYPSCLPS